MFRVENLIESGNGYYRVWDRAPGGEVVRTYTLDGVTYVDVEFEKTPGKIYTYVKDTNG